MKHNDKHILHVVNIYFVIPYFLGGQFEYFRELGYELNVVCSESPYLAPYAQQHHFGYREIPILRSINPIQDFKSIRQICRYIKETQSIKDKLAPARKQIVLGKGTCSGVDTQGKFNPQNIDPTKMAEFRSKWGINETDWVVGYTGRLVRDKGIIELVDAFQLIKANNPRLKLLLVGMFEERDALPQEVQDRIKNDPQIVFTDFQNEDMEYFYAMMNVYVLMSYREGFPTGTLEAQSMGVPVITTRVTGCCDSIVDGQTGVFVNRTPQQLAQVIEEMYKGERSFSKEQVRSWVTLNFDNLRVWEEIKLLYAPSSKA